MGEIDKSIYIEGIAIQIIYALKAYLAILKYIAEKHELTIKQFIKNR